MKKYTILAAVLVLTISMLTGCGCTRRRDDMGTVPSTDATILPTIPATMEPNVPETAMPTVDTTEETGMTDSTGTTDNTENTTGTDTATGPAARGRSNPIH